MPMRLLLATSNPNKVREIRPLLSDLPVELITLADLPAIPEPAETHTTFWENARQKAFAYARASGLTVVAEDSGIEIAAMNGEPGVYSARFLGPDVSYPDRFDEIHRRLASQPVASRDARFVTALAVVRSDQVLFETEAAIDGEIADTPRGEHGFGYDPIFFYRPLGKTTAELTLEEKAAVSHRARAFRDFARWARVHLDSQR
jgi:XTP/dITP diphosphohydrolase